MIDWSAVTPVLKSVFSGLALAAPVTPAFEAQWAEKQREFRHPEVQQALLLRVTRIADVQVERRYDFDADEDGSPPDPTLREVLFGMREFTIEARVESHDHSETISRWSWSMAERVRTGLFRQRAIDALVAVNVGIVRIGETRDISFKFDKHRVNAALFEATFNGAFNDVDTVTTNWFERVALTSAYKDAAGVTLSSPPNFTDLIVPPED